MLAIVSLSLWTTPALAQDYTLTVHQEALLGADIAELSAGAGAPSIVWDADRARFHLFFETQVDEPGCAEAWMIRAATSSDGSTWDLAGIPVAPGPETPCGGRRPAAFMDGDGGRFLYFDVIGFAGQDGIGLVQKTSAGVINQHVLPELDGLISPTVSRWEDLWLMLTVRADPLDPAVVAATSTDGLTWTVDGDTIAAGAVLSHQDGVLSPSLTCADAETFPWELWYGGWSGATTSWTWAISDDLSTWYILTSNLMSWSDDSAWASADVVQAGADRLVFYEDLDANGLPRIGLAATSDTWSVLDLESRRCFDPTP